MWTADWWWKTQASFPLSTVIPVILGSDKTMLSTLSGDKSAWPVYLSIRNLFKAKRRSVKSNGLILIGLLPRYCLSRIYGNKILRPLEEPAKSGIKVLSADSRTRHVYLRIASLLADYPEQCNIAGVKYSWCPRCEIDPDDMSGFNRRPRQRYPQRYKNMSVEAANDVGLWKFENCPNFANAHAGCNINTSMNVDRLDQLLKDVFKDHTWEWMVDFLKDIYGAEKALELIDERFFALTRFPDICQFGDKLT
ncbi:hypothetical protein K440DRAFT_556748 [Wilcoxina mikolae CBS 423.85]|nr:hypothetical protein K440DRAFT_556748 [Wilcoxina mikolae CBS 423.85]